jgi:hypothetical protein
MSHDEQVAYDAALKRADASEKALAAAVRSEQAKLSVLRLIFLGIALLMAYLGLLVAVDWRMEGAVDKDGVGMAFFQTSKDILLVLTGILGSAMASVFKTESSVPKQGVEE